MDRTEELARMRVAMAMTHIPNNPRLRGVPLQTGMAGRFMLVCFDEGRTYQVEGAGTPEAYPLIWRRLDLPKDGPAVADDVFDQQTLVEAGAHAAARCTAEGVDVWLTVRAALRHLVGSVPSLQPQKAGHVTRAAQALETAFDAWIAAAEPTMLRAMVKQVHSLGVRGFGDHARELKRALATWERAQARAEKEGADGQDRVD